MRGLTSFRITGPGGAEASGAAAPAGTQTPRLGGTSSGDKATVTLPGAGTVMPSEGWKRQFTCFHHHQAPGTALLKVQSADTQSDPGGQVRGYPREEKGGEGNAFCVRFHFLQMEYNRVGNNLAVSIGKGLVK